VRSFAPVSSPRVCAPSSTPPQTSTKANSVPMLDKSVTSVKFINSDGMATTRPVMMVENHGVLKRGWMLEKIGGKSPSRDIAIQMRGCPSWNTKSTVAIAMTALTATMPDIHGRFAPSGPNTNASGSPTCNCL
jgi:hypothetical protein